MTLLQQFIAQFHEETNNKKQHKQEESHSTLDICIQALLDEKFLPSEYLKKALIKLKKRLTSPINIAVVGQFSSGKSTFLNAILSRSLLPTGITPITSKVCKIEYGDQFMLDVLYKNGNRETRLAQDIAYLENNGEDIQQFVLKAPVALLKEVNFLDTPGFNSQRESDTETTQKILSDVDGIIWLTLIDNAGKQSELEILEKFMHNYAAKSLCVLNQKDRLANEKEVLTACEYVKNRFADFFADVIPVSSLAALHSKNFDKTHIVAQSLTNLTQQIACLNHEHYTPDQLYNLIEEHNKEITQFKEPQESQALYEESNFQKVLDFINTSIRPQSNKTKEFKIKQEYQHITNILIEQYRFVENIMLELNAIIEWYNDEYKELLKSIKTRHKQELHALAQEFRYHIESIVEIIFNNIHKEQQKFFTQKKAIIGEKIIMHSLEVGQLNHDRIQEQLFLGDSKNIKFFKNFQIKIRKASAHIIQSLTRIHNEFCTKIHSWQEGCEFIQKHHTLMSDTILINLKHYALKSYEEITESLAYIKADMENFIHSELDAFNILLNGVHIKLIEFALLSLVQRMNHSAYLHLESPKNFKIFIPSFDEIKTIIEESFALSSFISKIEGEETTADKLYQKMFIAHEQWLKEKTERLTERLGQLQAYQQEIQICNKKFSSSILFDDL